MRLTRAQKLEQIANDLLNPHDDPKHFIKQKTTTETRYADIGTKYTAYPTGCACGCGRMRPCGAAA